MKKPRQTIAILTLCCGFATAQTHAPTEAQCRADANLWLTQIASGPDWAHNPRLTINELRDMFAEMNSCYSAYDDVNTSSKAQEVNFVIATSIAVRFMDFLKRHNLDKQFTDEDAQGER